MGHSIPYPYSKIFLVLMQARNRNALTLDQAQEIWVKTCDIWKQNDPKGYQE